MRLRVADRDAQLALRQARPPAQVAQQLAESGERWLAAFRCASVLCGICQELSAAHRNVFNLHYLDSNAISVGSGGLELAVITYLPVARTLPLSS